MHVNDVITSIYASFNTRQINAALEYFHEDVEWPNGWKGGVIQGKEAVSEYWSLQWKEIDPIVTPESIEMLEDGRIRVHVHQVVKDLTGTVIFDGVLDHIYTFRKGLVEKMEIA